MATPSDSVTGPKQVRRSGQVILEASESYQKITKRPEKRIQVAKGGSGTVFGSCAESAFVRPFPGWRRHPILQAEMLSESSQKV